MFGKKSYSDSEVQEILKSFYLEKKKVSDLEAKLKNGTSFPEENRTTSPPHKEGKLELVVQFMRTRLENAQNENQELQNKIASFSTFELKHKREIEQLQLTLEMEKERFEELCHEETALKSQFSALREEILHLKAIETDKLAWDKKYQEQQIALQNGEKEIELLKQMMMKTMQEFKEERFTENQQYQMQVEETKASLEERQKELEAVKEQLLEKEQKVHHFSLDLAEKTSYLDQLKDEVQAKAVAHKELTQFTEDLQAKLMQAETGRGTAVESLKKKEELIEHLSSQVATLGKSLTEREEAIQNIEEERKEHESCLRAAQQHLAKKVREAAHLAEKYEESKQASLQLEKEKEELQKKLNELQAAKEAEQQLKLRQQEQHQENVKAIEAQSAKWEEKYFQLHEKWQDVDAKNRELKRLEERFSKMQVALNHFNQLMGVPFSLPICEELSFKSFPEMETPQVPHEKATIIQPSLFQNPKPTARFKETLFG